MWQVLPWPCLREPWQNASTLLNTGPGFLTGFGWRQRCQVQPTTVVCQKQIYMYLWRYVIVWSLKREKNDSQKMYVIQDAEYVSHDGMWWHVLLQQQSAFIGELSSSRRTLAAVSCWNVTRLVWQATYFGRPVCPAMSAAAWTHRTAAPKQSTSWRGASRATRCPSSSSSTAILRTSTRATRDAFGSSRWPPSRSVTYEHRMRGGTSVRSSVWKAPMKVLSTAHGSTSPLTVRIISYTYRSGNFGVWGPRIESHCGQLSL